MADCLRVGGTREMPPCPAHRQLGFPAPRACVKKPNISAQSYTQTVAFLKRCLGQREDEPAQVHTVLLLCIPFPFAARHAPKGQRSEQADQRHQKDQ